MAGTGILLVAAGGYFILRPKPLSTLEDCLKGHGCQGVVVHSGSKRIDTSTLESIMKIESVSRSAKLIDRIQRVSNDGNSTTFFVADVGKGPQVFPIMEVTEDPGPAYLLGSLLAGMFRISTLKANPAFKTQGEVYRSIGIEVDKVSSFLQGAGIETLEVSGTESVPVGEASAAYSKLAEYNEDSPLKVYRP